MSASACFHGVNITHVQCNITSNSSVQEDMYIFTQAQATRIVFALIVCVIPVVAVCGIIGNIFSICVLVRDGLDKSYNVMLISLACSDSSFLIPLIINGMHGAYGFVYPYDKLSFTFIFYKVLLFFDYGGAWVSYTLPILITFERLVVVFFPLTLARLITPRNTLYAVAFVFVGLYGMILYATIDDALTTTGPPREGNETVGGILILATFRNAIDSRHVLQEMGRYMFGPIPISFVFTGCLVLAIKVKLQSIQRRKMTNVSNSSASSSRVTLMLLVICFVYTITSIEQFLLFSGFVNQFFEWKDSNSMFQGILVELNNLIVVINCSINFLVYVFINEKFRNTFLTMMKNTCKRS